MLIINRVTHTDTRHDGNHREDYASSYCRSSRTELGRGYVYIFLQSCLIVKDSAFLAILTSHLTAEATSSIFIIPPVKFLRILITSLVHPRTTDTPLRRESSHLLSRILDIASPRTAKFDQVWKFQRKRKRRSEESDSEDDYGGILEEESLFFKSENVWDVIEWSFFKGQGGWIDILNHIVRILRNDFDSCKGGRSHCFWGC